MVREISIGLHLDANQILIKPADLNLSMVCFDEDHLYQILSNLLSNAAQFSSGTLGSIAVQFRARGRFVALLVMDDGPAVDSSVVNHLFEPFQTATKKGTGLGLYLCREYAQANHGRLQMMTDVSTQSNLSWVQPPYTKAFVLDMPVSQIN
jgi:two-component system sensor histidine kinase PilS (NtrC family)